MDAYGRIRDLFYTVLFGTCVAALACVWPFETPPPDIVEDVAAAAGLRPPASPLSLQWHNIAAPVYAHFDVKTAGRILAMAGHLSLGLFAVLMCALFSMTLPAVFRRGWHVASWWRTATRFVLYPAVALLCLSDPVWRAFRWFSPSALHMLELGAAAVFLVAHFRSARLAPLFASIALFGFAAADTPSAMLLSAAAIVAVRFAGPLRNIGAAQTATENPLAYSLVSWRLTLAFALSFAAGLALEARPFAAMDGLAAFGMRNWLDYAAVLPVIYIKAAIDGCTAAGALFFFSAAVVPFAAGMILLKYAADEERHLRYLHGVIYAALGLAAFTQLAGSKPMWFWNWTDGCAEDPVLRCTAMFLCAIAFMFSTAVFTLELYLRNFRRIETLRLPDAAEAPGAKEAFASARRLQRAVRACFILEPVLALACAIPPRAQTLERAMLEVAGDAARETAEECANVECLFTDGGLDAAIELAAAAKGRKLRALSMMGAADEPRDIYLRTRGVENAEDRELLKTGAADALRNWVRTRPELAGKYAVQIGFELWARDKRTPPRCSGLVAVQEGLGDAEAARGAAAARSLARRILALYREHEPDAIADRSIRDAFIFAQWRVSVIARHRANALDAAGDKESAVEDASLADALDAQNGALGRIRENMAWAGMRRLERMTPQEGVRRGLAKANYAFARVFALRVLDLNPDDAAANFAVGMDYFVQRQYARAEAYLERCLVQRPDDPAVLNNLAQCRLRRGDPKGAGGYAKRALKALPDSPQIKNTIAEIESALAKSAEIVYPIRKEKEEGEDK